MQKVFCICVAIVWFLLLSICYTCRDRRSAMALHVLDEANKCLGCKNPLCQKGCPIGTNIPEVIRLLKDGKLDVILFKKMPIVEFAPMLHQVITASCAITRSSVKAIASETEWLPTILCISPSLRITSPQHSQTRWLWDQLLRMA